MMMMMTKIYVWGLLLADYWSNPMPGKASRGCCPDFTDHLNSLDGDLINYFYDDERDFAVMTIKTPSEMDVAPQC